jgi:excisionase family DNA binding protein
MGDAGPRWLLDELLEIRRALEADRPALAARLGRVIERIREEPDAHSEYISTGEAANALGVSPNTVKKWVRQGLIRDAWTLPGSGHVKLGRSDVDRIRRQGSVSPPPERAPR